MKKKETNPIVVVDGYGLVASIVLPNGKYAEGTGRKIVGIASIGTRPPRIALSAKTAPRQKGTRR